MKRIKIKNIKNAIDTFIEMRQIRKFLQERKIEIVNKFYKVAVEQFMKDYINLYPTETLTEIGKAEEVYELIKLPKRSTSGSAGYDFFAPFNIEIAPNSSITIPTGIKCQIEDRWFLGLFPRSGLGFKYGLRLTNTTGIVDQDYFNNEKNEGHIMIKLFNPSDKTITIEQGKAFAQGIFLPYGITVDDESNGTRNGGFGSTDI